MKYATLFDPETCSKATIYFDFADEVINTSVTWFSTSGYTSIAPELVDEPYEKLEAIGTGKSKSYWIRRDGGDRDCLSDIHTAVPGDAAYKQFRSDFKNVCGFYPEFKKG